MKTRELQQRGCSDRVGFIFMSGLAWGFKEDLMKICPIGAKEGSGGDSHLLPASLGRRHASSLEIVAVALKAFAVNHPVSKLVCG